MWKLSTFFHLSLLLPSFTNYIICILPQFIFIYIFCNYIFRFVLVFISQLRFKAYGYFFQCSFLFCQSSLLCHESHPLGVFSGSAHENYTPQVTACFHNICLFAYTWIIDLAVYKFLVDTSCIKVYLGSLHCPWAMPVIVWRQPEFSP